VIAHWAGDAMNDPAVQQAVVCVGEKYVYVRVVGDIDTTADDVLSAAIEQLRTVHRAAVCVDLAGVGFAGTTLLTFLVRIINSIPQHGVVLLCRPGVQTRRLIQLSCLDAIAVICDELPADDGACRNSLTDAAPASSIPREGSRRRGWWPRRS